MGNQLARTTQVSASDYYLHEVPTRGAYKEVLGGGRFLKTVLCKHDEGLVVAKKHERKLADILKVFSSVDHPHVWPFQRFIDTDKAVYLLRQYFFSNLYDRISTRPFLSLVEKKWLAFQLLHALLQSHSRNICHGDIKCENVLVTSWNWVVLADFASFKPTYLPADNPADFSFFFDTGGRRRCYVAPERFYEPSDALVSEDAPLDFAMDIFSLGCLEDAGIRELITSMIHIQPAARLTIQEYINGWAPRIFPHYFGSLHSIFSKLLTLDSDTKVVAMQKAYPLLRDSMLQSSQSIWSMQDPPSTMQHAPKPLSAGSLPVAVVETPSVQMQSAADKFSSASHRSYAKNAPTLLKGLELAESRLQTDASHGAAGAMESIMVTGDISFYRTDFIVNGPSPWDIGNERDLQHRPKLELGENASAKFNTMDEVVVEEVIEYQVRDETGAWVSETPVLSGGPPSQKRDVSLPAEGGWAWITEWQVDSSAGQSAGGDVEGWQYDGTPDGSMERIWSGTGSSSSRLRRRRWVRKRRRQAVCVLPQPMAAASAPIAGAWVSPGSQAEAQPSVPQTGVTDVTSAGVQQRTSAGQARCDGMVLIAGLLCTCVRSVTLPQSRAATIHLLREVAQYCDDDARLQRIVPYIVALLPDPAATVKTAAVDALASVLDMVVVFPPSEAKIFPEYILPSLSLLPSDPEESIRLAYARSLAKLAITAQRFLTQAQDIDQASGVGAAGASTGDAPRMVCYDADLSALHDSIAHVVQELVTGPQSTPAVRRTLVAHVPALCSFFGRRESNDFLLPLLISFLNDRDRQLRASFFAYIAQVGAFVGRASLDAFLLPCIEQALTDAEDAVVANALGCLAALCERVLLRKKVLLAAVSGASPLLRHPSCWVRNAAISFVAAAACSMSPADAQVFLAPIMQRYLVRRPRLFTDEAALREALRPPVSASQISRQLTRSDSHESTVIPSLEGASAHFWSSQSIANLLLLENHPSRPGTSDAAGNDTMYKGSASSEQRLVTQQSPDGYRSQAPVRSFMVSNVNGATSRSMSIIQQWQGAQQEQAARTARGRFAARPPRSGQRLDDSRMDYGMETPSHSRTGSDSTLPVDEPGRPNVVEGYIRTTPSHVQVRAWETDEQQPPPSRPASAGPEKTENLYSVQYSTARSTVSQNGAPPKSRTPSPLPASAGGVMPTMAQNATAGLDRWQPKGVLVAHLQEHKRAVCAIEVASDSLFFASGSADGSVRIWDCRRLEKDVSFRSRVTYSGHGGKVTSIAMMRDTGNGVERYIGAADVRVANSGEGAALWVQSHGGGSTGNGVAPLLLFATQNGGIHAWDLRLRRDAWNLPYQPQEGLILQAAQDPAFNWIVTGSSRGMFTLWDLRFQIPVNSWRHPAGCAPDAMAAAQSALQSHGSASSPLVYAAAGQNEVALWNAADGSCQQVLRLLDSADQAVGSTPPAALRTPNRSAASDEFCISELSQFPSKPANFCALIPIAGASALLTAGSDRSIRMWHPARTEQSFVICGPSAGGEIGSRRRYDVRSYRGVQVVQELPAAPRIDDAASTSSSGSSWAPSYPGGTAQDLPQVLATSCHRDAILSLGIAHVSQRLLLSGSRDGIIKVWK
eukprot:jgi/Chlat1/3863/Chrsp26S04158